MKTPGWVACSCRCLLLSTGLLDYWPCRYREAGPLGGERVVSFRERCLSSIASHVQMGHGCVFMATTFDTCEWDSLGYFQFAEQLNLTCTDERLHTSPSMSRVMPALGVPVSCFVKPMGQWIDSCVDILSTAVGLVALSPAYGPHLLLLGTHSTP
ncbi:hypothetical protein NQZ79_g8641 [Umbelopsis isabellina]|nr:hypothetical protein NQZ79_g8641 [Umbelopsis isabellina]